MWASFTITTTLPLKRIPAPAQTRLRPEHVAALHANLTVMQAPEHCC